jgi:hypothetical protein
LLLVALWLAGHERLDLGRHRGQVRIERLFEQALLLGVVGLALGGELQPLEDRVLVRELGDDGLLEGHLALTPVQQCVSLGDLGTSRAQGLAQLFGIESVELIGDHEP